MTALPRVPGARAVAALATLALLLSLDVTAARAQMNASLSVAAGATAPVSTLGDVAKVGYHVWVGADFRRPISPLGFRVDAMFTELDHESFDDVNWRIVSGTANLVYTRSPAEGPYLLGGVGVYRLSATTNGRTIDFTESTNAGLNAGIGVRFALTGFSTFAEVRYHYVFGDTFRDGKPAFIPFTFGVTF
jgi:hypothetical protein